MWLNWVKRLRLTIHSSGRAEALKRGDPRIIGSLAYLTPLTSTLILIVLGGRSLTWVSALAMLLIVAGAMLGSLELFRLKSLSAQAR